MPFCHVCLPNVARRKTTPTENNIHVKGTFFIAKNVPFFLYNKLQAPMPAVLELSSVRRPCTQTMKDPQRHTTTPTQGNMPCTAFRCNTSPLRPSCKVSARKNAKDILPANREKSPLCCFHLSTHRTYMFPSFRRAPPKNHAETPSVRTERKKYTAPYRLRESPDRSHKTRVRPPRARADRAANDRSISIGNHSNRATECRKKPKEREQSSKR